MIKFVSRQAKERNVLATGHSGYINQEKFGKSEKENVSLPTTGDVQTARHRYEGSKPHKELA